MAAVLACGPGAILSGGSAAALWDIADAGQSVEIMVPHITGRRRSGIEIHSGSALTQTDVTTVDRIPCTSLPRTLLDLATSADCRKLARAIDRAELLRTFDLDAVTELLERSHRARGAGALAAALAAYGPLASTASEVEERLWLAIADARLPTPAVNTWLPLPEGGGYRPDFLWRRERLIVEVDGRTHHARRGAFDHDRRRDRRLALIGYETLRFAASEVLDDATRVVTEIAAFLATRHVPTHR